MEPASWSTPLGETKIPLPTMIPIIIQIQFSKLSSFFKVIGSGDEDDDDDVDGFGDRESISIDNLIDLSSRFLSLTFRSIID